MAKGKRKKDASKQDKDDSDEIKSQELIQKINALKEQCQLEQELKEDFENRIKHIKNVWEMDKKELEQKQLQYDKYQVEVKQNETKHQLDIDKIKDQIRAQLYEQANELTQKKIDALLEHHSLQDQLDVSHKSLESDIIECNSRLDEMEIAHNAFLMKLRHEHDDRISELREQFKQNSKEITMQSERDVKRIKYNFESMMIKEIQKLEDEYSDQSKRLTKIHEENLDQVRRQMNIQIKDEIEQIKQLKHDYYEKKKQVHKTEKILNAITDKNKELVSSLEKAERDISHFEKDEEEMKVQNTMIRKQKRSSMKLRKT